MPEPTTTPAAAPATEPANTGAQAKANNEKTVLASRETASRGLDSAINALLDNTQPAGTPAEKADAGKESPKPESQPSKTTAEETKPKEVETDTVEAELTKEPQVEFGNADDSVSGDAGNEVEIEEDPEHRGGFPKDWPEAAIKNLLKEREKRKEAKAAAEAANAKLREVEERAIRAEAEAKSAKESGVKPAANLALADIRTPQQLDEFKDKQLDALAACEKYSNGKPAVDDAGNPVLDNNGQPVMAISREQVAEIKGKILLNLHRHIPARAEFLQNKQAYDADTVNRYPWLKNPDSKAAQEVAKIEENWDSIANGAGRRRMIVWALRGRELEYAENATKRTATPPAKKPPTVPPKTSAERPAATAKSDKETKRSAATAAIRSGKGGKEALEAFFAADSED